MTARWNVSSFYCTASLRCSEKKLLWLDILICIKSYRDWWLKQNEQPTGKHEYLRLLYSFSVIPTVIKSLFLKDLLFERQRGKRKRRTFHLLVHSDDHNGQASLRPGAWHSIHLYSVGGRGPNAWAIFICCVPRHISRKLDLNWSSPESNRYT